MEKDHLLIIGGGAAGLMAAYLLKDKMQITIIEARGYLGGRMKTVIDGENYAEAGAEFVHGDLPITMSMLAAAGIKAVKTEGGMLISKNGVFQAGEEHNDEQEKMIDKVSSLTDDMTLDEFLEKYYKGDQYQEFRNDTRSFAEGFDLADPATASVQALGKEWSSGGDNYRIPGGYEALVNYLMLQLDNAGVKIKLDTVIKEVNWKKGLVELSDRKGQLYAGTKLLVTVPVSILALNTGEASLNFTPEIDRWQKAAHDIGFGSVIKIIFRFNQTFWPDDTGFIISDQTIKTWWTQLPDESPVLTGWTGGPAAEKLVGLTEEEIMEEGIRSLAAIFHLPEAEIKSRLISKMVFNWKGEKFSLGGYSFSYPASSDSRDILTIPVEETIYFAGEAIYHGDHPGTVEAAFESARAVSEALSKTINS